MGKRISDRSAYLTLLFVASDEPVGKVPLTSENGVFALRMPARKNEIVDCGPFCEVISFLQPQRLS